MYNEKEDLKDEEPKLTEAEKNCKKVGVAQGLPAASFILRELVDNHRFKGKRLNELRRKQLLRALHFTLMYIPFLEVTLKKNNVKELETDLTK